MTATTYWTLRTRENYPASGNLPRFHGSVRTPWVTDDSQGHSEMSFYTEELEIKAMVSLILILGPFLQKS